MPLLSESYNLLILYPLIAESWHPIKNNGVLPVNVLPGSKIKYWWICEKGHEWETTVNHRTSQKQNCPYCASKRASITNNLSINYPDISKEWNYEKNMELRPENILAKSAKKVWWLCKEKHEWQMVISNRTLQGQNCPYCSGRRLSPGYNLAKLYPNLIKEWNYEKNDFYPENCSPFSNKKVWWRCNKGHEWKAIICSRSSGKNCPYCSGNRITSERKLNTLYPAIAKDFATDLNILETLDSISYNSSKRIWWRCNKGHEWDTRVYNRTINHTNCPACHVSSLEDFIATKLALIKYDKPCLINASYKPDFQLTENLYLNVDGLYWHCEKKRESNYHLKMREAFETEGKRIIQFYEDEVYQKWDIVRSIINNILGNSSIKLNARECVLSKINKEQAFSFLNENHLMGYYIISNYYGLIYNNKLVSLIAIRKIKEGIEITRFCNRIGANVIGGFSKLLSHVIKLYNPQNIVSFADLRYATGRLYEKIGFKLISISQGWSWTDTHKRFNRLTCRASTSKTERENAIEKGLFKIYDAGQAKYALSLVP